MDPPVFINWLPGGLAKTRPTGHRRGRPPRTDFEHSWQKVLLSLYDGRRRGRPPRQVLPWSLRPKGHRRGRPQNNYSSLEIDPVSRIFFIGFPDASCLLHVLLLLDGDVNNIGLPDPNPTPLLFAGGRRGEGEELLQRPNHSLAFFVIAIFKLMKVLNDKSPGSPSAINNPKTLHVLLRPKSAIFFPRFPEVSSRFQRDIRKNKERARS